MFYPVSFENNRLMFEKSIARARRRSTGAGRCISGDQLIEDVDKDGRFPEDSPFERLVGALLRQRQPLKTLR